MGFGGRSGAMGLWIQSLGPFGGRNARLRNCLALLLHCTTSKSIKVFDAFGR